MKKIITYIVLSMVMTMQAFASHEVSAISAEESLKLLKEGNNRFLNMQCAHPNLNKERLHQVATEGQHPYAVIIACSDSRVPLEYIFDAGLGDLFEIKNAGNLTDDHVIGSVEYAISHLGTKLVVVMGHSSCGCIQTALAQPKNETKYINSLIRSVKPAMKMAETQKGELNSNVTKNNAILSARAIAKGDEVVRKFVKEKDVIIVPAHYDIVSGKVEFYKEYAIDTKNIDLLP